MTRKKYKTERVLGYIVSSGANFTGVVASRLNRLPRPSSRTGRLSAGIGWHDPKAGVPGDGSGAGYGSRGDNMEVYRVVGTRTIYFAEDAEAEAKAEELAQMSGEDVVVEALTIGTVDEAWLAAALNGSVRADRISVVAFIRARADLETVHPAMTVGWDASAAAGRSITPG